MHKEILYTCLMILITLVASCNKDKFDDQSYLLLLLNQSKTPSTLSTNTSPQIRIINNSGGSDHYQIMDAPACNISFADYGTVTNGSTTIYKLIDVATRYICGNAFNQGPFTFEINKSYTCTHAGGNTVSCSVD